MAAKPHHDGAACAILMLYSAPASDATQIVGREMRQRPRHGGERAIAARLFPVTAIQYPSEANVRHSSA
jgi:hypothetical protein